MKSKEEFVAGKIKLSIEGEPLEIQVAVPAKPVKLRKMLPVFQGMTDLVVEVSAQKVKALGKKISCKKGCGACCRQMVPISRTEAFEIAHMVEQFPLKERERIKRRFTEAVEHFRKIGLFEKLEKAESSDSLTSIGLEYFHEGIPCPFLEAEACLIHRNRPLACREYLVTSPAKNCSNPSAENVKRVELLFLPSKILMRMEQKTEKGRLFIPLIMALEWVEGNKSEEKNLKTGQEWMANFFRELTGSEIPKA